MKKHTFKKIEFKNKRGENESGIIIFESKRKIIIQGERGSFYERNKIK